MHEIKCQKCGGIRKVKKLKKDMPPLCKKCCQEGKEKSLEHRAKLSEAIKEIQTEDVLEKKSQYMKEHPEHWQGKIIGEGDTFAHTEETKNKIGHGVRKAAERRHENES